MIILLSSTLILMFNLINTIIDSKDNITTYIQPATIFIFVVSLSNFITADIELKSLSVIAVLVLLYTIIYHFVKSKNRKNIYFWSSIVTTVLALLIAIDSAEKLTSIIVLICLAYHYITEENDNRRAIFYIGVLISIYTSLVTLELLGLPIIYNALITLWIYILIKFLQKETKTIESITSIAIVIPAYTIVNNLTIAYEYQAILTTTLSLYVLYLINTLLIKNQSTKNIISILAISLLLLMILDTNIVIGVYIGIVGIIVMMIGFYKKEYKELFITGIVITIINIIYQLQDLWEKIPFWLYLLVTGLGLIGFVTYKEVKEIENANITEDKEKNKENLESTDKVQNENEIEELNFEKTQKSTSNKIDDKNKLSSTTKKSKK